MQITVVRVPITTRRSKQRRLVRYICRNTAHSCPARTGIVRIPERPTSFLMRLSGHCWPYYAILTALWDCCDEPTVSVRVTRCRFKFVRHCFYFRCLSCVNSVREEFLCGSLVGALLVVVQFLILEHLSFSSVVVGRYRTNKKKIASVCKQEHVN